MELSVCSVRMVSDFNLATVIRITNVSELGDHCLWCFMKYLLHECAAFWKPCGLLLICMHVWAYLCGHKYVHTPGYTRLTPTSEASTKCMGARSWKKSNGMALLADG